MSTRLAVCPQCRAPLPPDQPCGGLCPACAHGRETLLDDLAPTRLDPPRDLSLASPPVDAGRLTLLDGPQDAGTRSARPPESVPPAFPAPVGALPAGARAFGRYGLIASLGTGGMGTVWKAWDPHLGRLVALKQIKEEIHADADARPRFVREAQLAARLRHPHIVAVYEVGECDGRSYITMEFVAGRSFESFLDESASAKRAARAEAFPRWRDEVAILADIADAVAFAHANGIVHRDLKPANVMLEERAARGGNGAAATPPPAGKAPSREPDVLPHAYVMDFGIAKDLSRAPGVEGGPKLHTLTSTGQLIGTPGYMSPEQADGAVSRTGPHTDVWALGVMLFEILTGRLPFEHPSPMAQLSAILLDEPDPPRRGNARIPEDLESVCMKCLEKDARRRYPTAAELVAELRRWLAGEPVQARPIGTVDRFLRKVRRHRKAVAIAAGGLLAAGMGAVVLLDALEAERAESARLAVEREAREREHAAELERLARETAQREAAEKTREDARALLKSALVLKQHSPSDAASLLGQAIERDASFAEAWLERGRFHREQGEFREAIRDLNRAIELAPDQFEGFAERMTAHLCMNDFLRVGSDIDTIVRRWPEHHYAKLGKAAMLWAQGQAKEAVLEFEKIARECPDEALAHAGLGGCLHDIGRHQEARGALDRALELEPKNVMALNNRASLLLAIRQLDPAIADATRSIGLYPWFYWAWETRGKALFLQGEFASAEADLEQAVKLGPTRADACLILALTYAAQGKAPAAVKAATRALQLGSPRVDCLYVRALAQAEAGRFDEAGTDAAELEPLRKDLARTVQAAVALRRGDPGKAFELAVEALALTPGLADATVVKARADAALGRHAAALEGLRQACVLDPRRARALEAEISAAKAKATNPGGGD